MLGKKRNHFVLQEEISEEKVPDCQLDEASSQEDNQNEKSTMLMEKRMEELMNTSSKHMKNKE